jgi:long-subunit fatty acid transport protein
MAGGQINGYKSLVPISSGVNQLYSADTKGGYNEIAIAYATNMNDKLYLGGSVTIPVISYQRDLDYSETDATNNSDNNFAYFKYHETATSKGLGVGLKLGMIYKPKEYWRVGLAVHTPQWIGFKDQIRSSMTANVEGYDYMTPRTVTSDELNDGNPGESNYHLLTPWRAIASVSYVFRQVANTHKQRAFASADIEYVNYRGARYSANDNSQSTLVDYYKMINKEIKDYYKGNINIRLGGELKFDPWMFRLGAAYYGSPYADASLKANRIITSGGVGYRNHGIFIDLTYSRQFVTDVNFPYRLNDVANTFATQKGGKSSVIMTFGVKI